MTTALIYVHVTRPDAADEFNYLARKFLASYKDFTADTPHTLVVVWANGEPSDVAKSVYDGMSCRFISYDGGGMDVGAQQHAALAATEDFAVAINSRAFFHREGWLRRLVECREQEGPGVYAGMASYEGCPLGQVWPNPHLRTVFYGMDTALWKSYPHIVNSRADSFRFESGEWNVANWCLDNGHKAKLVTWDECLDKPDWRKPPNVFRRGNQTNCLVWDRHTQIFSDNPGAHAHLEGLANGTP